jgi:hypothetical protein
LWPPATGEAHGGAAVPQDPNRVLGSALFEQCIRWVARGHEGMTATRDFHIRVLAELELEGARHQGPMSLWWKAPDKYRVELTTGGRTTTKILNGPFLWIVHPDGHVQRMHGTSEGAAAIKQLGEDRDRMSDLARFITLRSLKGPGVAFTFEGEKHGNGLYAGNWLKVTRSAPGLGTMHFWLAYTKDAAGRYLASWPGIVRIDGDPRQRIPTEDYILRDWAQSPAGQPESYRYPRSIQALSLEPGQAPVRFLKARVQDIRINGGISDLKFRPPLPRGR